MKIIDINEKKLIETQKREVKFEMDIEKLNARCYELEVRNIMS
jgi:hypothetical protein